MLSEQSGKGNSLGAFVGDKKMSCLQTGKAMLTSTYNQPGASTPAQRIPYIPTYGGMHTYVLREVVGESIPHVPVPLAEVP